MVLSQIRLSSEILAFRLRQVRSIEAVFEGLVSEALRNIDSTDLVIIDLRPHSQEPLNLIGFIRRHYPKIKVIAVGVYTKTEALRCVEEDISGFLLIDASMDNLLRLIARVQKGEHAIYPGIGRISKLPMPN